MSGISRFIIFGNRVVKIREIPGSGGNYSGSGILEHITSVRHGFLREIFRLQGLKTFLYFEKSFCTI